MKSDHERPIQAMQRSHEHKHILVSTWHMLLQEFDEARRNLDAEKQELEQHHQEKVTRVGAILHRHGLLGLPCVVRHWM